MLFNRYAVKKHVFNLAWDSAIVSELLEWLKEAPRLFIRKKMPPEKTEASKLKNVFIGGYSTMFLK